MITVCFVFYSGRLICSELSDLKVFDEQYPKAIYFRNVENSAANTAISYEKWSKRWSKLDGMVVKALDEEIPGRSQEAQRKFIQYKKDNPTKLMLLHFNGNARDPNFDLGAFHAEDWTYFVGTYSVDFISKKDTKIFVENSDVFREADDIAIVPVANNGELIWQYAEQAKLLQVNKDKSITVKRDVFSSQVRSYQKGKVYIAPHVSQPAVSPNSKQALWRYNFTNVASTDGMPERLAENLIHYLDKEGALTLFDGVEFDVLADIRGLTHPSRKTPIDYNFDGIASKLDKNYQQQYRLGVHRFLTHLRKALGSEKLILADGNELNQQRAFGILNGIESETWPSHWDHEIDTWSSGMNRHLYWYKNSFKPNFSYIKIGYPPQNKKQRIEPPENHRRLRTAASMMMNATAAPAYKPKGLKISNWPELTLEGSNLGWLGMPIGEFKYIDKEGNSVVLQDVTNLLIPLKKSERLNRDDLIVFTNKIGNKTTFGLPLTLAATSDVLVMAELNLNSSAVSSNERARLITVQGEGLVQQMSWIGRDQFQSHYSFYSVPKGDKRLTFLLENSEMLNVTNVSVYNGEYVAFREFENGFVLANPSNSDRLVSSAKLLKKSASLIASNKLSKLNKLENAIMIPAKDAVFYRYD